MRNLKQIYSALKALMLKVKLNLLSKNQKDRFRGLFFSDSTYQLYQSLVSEFLENLL